MLPTNRYENPSKTVTVTTTCREEPHCLPSQPYGKNVRGDVDLGEGAKIANEATNVASEKIEDIKEKHGDELDELQQRGQQLADDLGLDGERMTQILREIIDILREAALDIQKDVVVQREAHEALKKPISHPEVTTVPTTTAFHAGVALKRALGITEESREELKIQLEKLFETLKGSESVLWELLDAFQKISERTDFKEFAIYIFAIVLDGIKTLKEGGDVAEVLRRVKVLMADEFGEDVTDQISDGMATILETMQKHESLIPDAIGLVREIKAEMERDGDVGRVFQRSEELLNRLKDEIIPFISERIMLANIPAVSMEMKKLKQTFEVKLVNMQLAKFNINPAKVGLITKQDDHVSKLVIGIQGIDVALKNVQWDALQKHWPHIHDHGLVDVAFENGCIALVVRILTPADKSLLFTEGVKVLVVSSEVILDKLNVRVHGSHFDTIENLLFKMFRKTIKYRIIDTLTLEIKKQTDMLSQQLTTMVNGLLGIVSSAGVSDLPATTAPPLLQQQPTKLEMANAHMDADREIARLRNVEGKKVDLGKSSSSTAHHLSTAFDKGLDHIESAAQKVSGTLKERELTTGVNDGSGKTVTNVTSTTTATTGIPTSGVKQEASAAARDVQETSKVVGTAAQETAEQLKPHIQNAAAPVKGMTGEALKAADAAKPHLEAAKPSAEEIKEQVLEMKAAIQPHAEASKADIEKLRQEGLAAKEAVKPFVEDTIDRLKVTASEVKKHVDVAEKRASESAAMMEHDKGGSKIVVSTTHAGGETAPVVMTSEFVRPRPPGAQAVTNAIDREKRAADVEVARFVDDLEKNAHGAMSALKPHLENVKEPLKSLKQNALEAKEEAKPFVQQAAPALKDIKQKGEEALEAARPHLDAAKEHATDLQKEAEKAKEDIEPQLQKAQTSLKDTAQSLKQHGQEATAEMKGKLETAPMQPKLPVSAIVAGLRESPTTSDVVQARKSEEQAKETTENVEKEMKEAKAAIEPQVQAAKQEFKEIGQTAAAAMQDLQPHAQRMAEGLTSGTSGSRGHDTFTEKGEFFKQETDAAGEKLAPKVSELRERFERVGEIGQDATKRLEPHVNASIDEIKKAA